MTWFGDKHTDARKASGRSGRERGPRGGGWARGAAGALVCAGHRQLRSMVSGDRDPPGGGLAAPELYCCFWLSLPGCKGVINLIMQVKELRLREVI